MRMKTGDCGICVFAMVAGITYEESLEFFRTRAWYDKKDRKMPLVWKYEMERALNFKGIRQQRLPSYDGFERIFGRIAVLQPKCSGYFRHWIIYLPKEGYVIDPDPKQPDQVTDLSRYKFLTKYFMIP